MESPHTITLSDAVSALKKGQVGIMPTDTVYGIVARALDELAVTRLYAAKGREGKPGTVIAASVQQLRDLGIAQADLEMVAKWWPNPLSAVLPLSTREYLHQGLNSLAMRVVADSTIREVLEQTGPLLTSSANLPGHPEATTIDEAYEYLHDTVDFYVDGGVIAGRLPSTIIRPTARGIEVLRHGTIEL